MLMYHSYCDVSFMLFLSNKTNPDIHYIEYLESKTMTEDTTGKCTILTSIEDKKIWKKAPTRTIKYSKKMIS